MEKIDYIVFVKVQWTISLTHTHVCRHIQTFSGLHSNWLLIQNLIKDAPSGDNKLFRHILTCSSNVRIKHRSCLFPEYQAMKASTKKYNNETGGSHICAGKSRLQSCGIWHSVCMQCWHAEGACSLIFWVFPWHILDCHSRYHGIHGSTHPAWLDSLFWSSSNHHHRPGATNWVSAFQSPGGTLHYTPVTQRPVILPPTAL